MAPHRIKRVLLVTVKCFLGYVKILDRSLAFKGMLGALSYSITGVEKKEVYCTVGGIELNFLRRWVMF